jgi:DNA primase
VSSGVAVLSRTGDLIEQHPGKTAGVFAAYMAISNFYANWFLPEPEQAVDPLQGLELYPDAAPDENSVVHEYIVEGLEDLFEVFPEFASEVKKLISKSDYSDPTDDPQLIENLETLLQQSVPGNQNVTYQDYLHEITVLAASDAHDEIEADPDSESTSRPPSQLMPTG